MKRLCLFLILAVSAGRTEAEPGRWSAQISEASARFGVPKDWIWRVMRIESGGRTRFAGMPVVSRAGAMGLMQLMPATWAELRARLGLGPDPFDPHDNILAGAFYLRSMYERFGYPGLFAAYNMGPSRYASYLAGTASLPRETVDYLAKAGAGASARPALLHPPAPLFFVRQSGLAGENDAAPKPPDLLFVVRR